MVQTFLSVAKISSSLKIGSWKLEFENLFITVSPLLLFLPASQMALKRPVDEGDDLRRYSYRERSSRVHQSRQKISVISGTCPPLADLCLKNLVNPVILSKNEIRATSDEIRISLTKYQRLSTNDSFGPFAQLFTTKFPKK